ncbi:MAG TPA: PilZ domain-containing protein, partial [Miltoncostaeaceae bacterium]|nr:PilZ domain-containing protein [Miltoncostaeaceae bacterium]
LVLGAGVVPVSAGPLMYAAIFLPQLVLTPLASRALTRGRYQIIETERYSIVRMEAYVQALAAFIPGVKASFKVTPKGARDDRAVVKRALILPVGLAALTGAALVWQGVAQWLTLPGRLPLGALIVTSSWALVNIAKLTSVALWARTVRHRRSSHRFPVRLAGAYGVGDDPVSRSARVTDLSRLGARLVVDGTRTVGERLRLVLLLTDGPLEIEGTVAAAWAGGAPGETMVGVRFDPLSSATSDAIVEWCFRQPLGPDVALSTREIGETTAAAVNAARRLAASDPVRVELDAALAQAAAAEDDTTPDAPGP